MYRYKYKTIKKQIERAEDPFRKANCILIFVDTKMRKHPKENSRRVLVYKFRKF